MGNASAEALRGEPVRTPLQRHVADLKRRLYWCGFTFIVACVLTFPHADEMIAWLKKPYHDDLIFYAPTEAIFAAIKVALLGGITLSMPVFLYHLWKFSEPALLPGERRWIVPFLAIASVFFAMGVSFANFVIVPLALQFMLQFGIDRALVPQLGVGFYVDFNAGDHVAVPVAGRHSGSPGSVPQACHHGKSHPVGDPHADLGPVQPAAHGGATDHPL